MTVCLGGRGGRVCWCSFCNHFALLTPSLHPQQTRPPAAETQECECVLCLGYQVLCGAPCRDVSHDETYPCTRAGVERHLFNRRMALVVCTVCDDQQRKFQLIDWK